MALSQKLRLRSHLEGLLPVCQKALDEARLTWANIDGIGITYGAGLAGSLLIGVLTAQALAICQRKPLYACNHVEGHVYANFITEAKNGLKTCQKQPELPNVGAYYFWQA